MKRVLIFILFFIIAFSSYSRNFVIAGIPEEPNRWAERNGIVQGIDVDIIDYIMKKYDKILKEMKADGILEKIYKKYGFEYTFKTEVKIKKIIENNRTV